MIKKIPFLFYPIQHGIDCVNAIQQYYHHHHKRNDKCDDVINILLLVWPPYMSSMAYHAAKKFVKLGGKIIFYVGELSFGCTGDENFHVYIKQKFSKIQVIDVAPWVWNGDSLFIFKLKEEHVMIKKEKTKSYADVVRNHNKLQVKK